MKKLLLIGLCFYASSTFSSGPILHKRLNSFMTLPADFDDYTHDQVFNFVANEFRASQILRSALNPFYVGVVDKGWFYEMLEDACRKGNADAQYIRAQYDEKYPLTTVTWWEHHQWEHDEKILQDEGSSPDMSTDTFFKVIKGRENDPRAKHWIESTKSYITKDVLKRMTPEDIKKSAITDPDYWTNHATWLTKWKNADIIELKAPNTWDYYIGLCSNHAAQLTKWKQESELIRTDLAAGNFSNASLQALKDIMANPFMLTITLDFTRNHYPRLKTEFEAAATLVEIERALKFLKELEDSGILTTSFGVQHALRTKKTELEVKIDNDPNKQGKDKKKNPNLTSQSSLQMVTVGLIFALGGYLIYKYYLQRTDTSRYETEAEA